MLKTLVLGAATAMNLCDDFEFDVYYDSVTEEIVFETVSPDGSWLGLLLGSSSMSNTDSIAFHADGVDSRARDFHSRGETFLDFDPKQSVRSTITDRSNG